MTAARRFEGLGWFAAGVVMALAFYLVSLGVAAERAKLADREAAIVQAKRDLRQLETEFQTRANLAQLERWNGEVLSLAAPRPDQYLHNVAAFADLRPGQGAPVVQLANVVVPQGPPDLVPPEIGSVPTSPAPAIPQPALARPIAPVIAAIAVDTRPLRPQVVQAVATRIAPSTRLASAEHIGRAPAAVIERALLGDGTLNELKSGARAETASLQ